MSRDIQMHERFIKKINIKKNVLCDYNNWKSLETSRRLLKREKNVHFSDCFVQTLRICKHV